MSAVAKAADPRGLKRVCASCGIRFYDLNKRPIACPNCATEFTGEIKVKSRRSRLPADDGAVEAKARKTAGVSDDEDASDLQDDADVISLEDLDEDSDDDAEDTADADLDLDDEDLEVLDEDLEDIEEIESEDDIEIEQEDKD